MTGPNLDDLGPLPSVHPREQPFQAAELYLQQAVNEWLTRHPGLTLAEVLCALQSVQLRIIRGAVRVERDGG